MTPDSTDMFFLDTPDGPLAYRDTGWGAPLVLLHGGFVDHRMWDAQITHFARRFRVVAPDTRGHGLSANASVPFRQTDEVAALLRHLDVGPAVLAGVSMGAGIAVDTALEHPELVRALVVSGAGTSEPEFRDPWVREIQAEWARATAAGDAAAFVAAHLLFVPGPHRTFDEVDPGVLRTVREMVRHTLSKHTTAQPPRLVPVTDTWARAAKLDVPVLAVSGALDSYDCVAMAERLARSVADGRTATVEGCAHYPNMERPEAFNDILQGFLDEVAGASVTR